MPSALDEVGHASPIYETRSGLHWGTNAAQYLIAGFSRSA